ncbi:zinc finger protein 391 isoform X23 [Agrilus planipennis]|uniref:Zinc finger protein 391 isoform X23 n=1 Tax=Agrilus planipennis TaxID=224129 RepID=A0A1W4XRD7_AGRPL|nr:zinc finger protein 391 isoform X23 [Agrilus planipennis]
MVNSVELMQLCRLCLVKDEVNIPIFDNETDVQQIFLKISTCLPVKVTQDDNLPKKICNDCSYKLDLCYQFWNTSANSEKQLVTWLNEVGLSQETLNEAKLQKTESNSTPGLVLKQETIEPESESSHEVVNNVSTESQEYILQQQQLPYQTPAFPFTDDNFVSGESANAGASKTHTNNKRESTLKRKRQAVATVTQPDSDDDVDEDIDDPTETKVAKTEETSDDDRDDDGLNDEESTEFAGVPSTSTDNEQPGPSGIGKNVVDAPDPLCLKEDSMQGDGVFAVKREWFKCGECTIAFRNKRDVFCHMKREHEPNLRVCNICMTAFRNEQDRDKHQLIVHKKKRPHAFRCGHCGRGCTSDLALKHHTLMYHSDNLKVLRCEYCNKVIKVKNWLNHVTQQHIDPQRFRCDICKKEFHSKSFLTIHQATHKPDYVRPTFNCEKCCLRFSTKAAMKRHESAHENPNMFICEHCGKSVTSAASLRTHITVIHEREKPHICSDCGKGFGTRNTLRVHKLLHTKEKPHMCHMCEKRFTQRNSLVAHMRSMHTGEKPYKCRFCTKSFVTKSALKLHSKRHDLV